MKINVEFDLTPDEFRQALGLPNIETFQQELLERIQRQMESGVEGYDPMSLMQPFLQQPALQQGLSQGLSQGLASFGNYQKMMLDMLSQAAQKARNDGSDGDADESSSARASKPSSSKSSTSSGTTSSRSSGARASARSRSTKSKS
ncbi:hypothetical protein [Halomonas huangheensis]|uniref:Uncharacterized protein n=1 Tax=Halomonas huangheensis TaxID=1178482 RepID=W1N3Z0_9GAMM|nr:hypothetical protein [Halomonas huangheensis]ALM51777.1 hypothetical protein AR456_05350 [Halomonas huangheensis]ERL50282.1 hypothetical protein BJB45_03890 [Halomonas huangheensis]